MDISRFISMAKYLPSIVRGYLALSEFHQYLTKSADFKPAIASSISFRLIAVVGSTFTIFRRLLF